MWLRDLCWRCLLVINEVFARIGRHVNKPAYPFESMERYRNDYRKLVAENEREARHQQLGTLLKKPRARSREEILADKSTHKLDLSDDSDTDEDEDPVQTCIAQCNMYGALNMECKNGFMGMSHWKVKYFILQGPYVIWWHDQDDDELAGYYHLAQMRRVVEFEDESCMFAVELREDGSRQLYEAHDQTERDKWVAAIERMLKKIAKEPENHSLRLAEDNFDLYSSMAGVAKRILNPPNRETGGFS